MQIDASHVVSKLTTLSTYVSKKKTTDFAQSNGSLDETRGLGLFNCHVIILPVVVEAGPYAFLKPTSV